MALTNVQLVRLEIGLTGGASALFSDEEIEYYLGVYDNNIKKTSKDIALKVLFNLTQYVHERSGTELEIWGHTWYENYKKTLELYLNNPAYNDVFSSLKFYAGGVSVQDIQENINNPDNLTIDVDIGIPTDGDAVSSGNTNKNIFKANKLTIYNSPFSL